MVSRSTEEQKRRRRLADDIKVAVIFNIDKYSNQIIFLVCYFGLFSIYFDFFLVY
jgi:hypothetical protein